MDSNEGGQELTSPPNLPTSGEGPWQELTSPPNLPTSGEGPWQELAPPPDTAAFSGAPTSGEGWRLGQDLLALLEVPDRLRPDLQEPLL